MPSKAVPLMSGNALVEKDKEIKELNKKNNSLRRQNDQLLKERFELENRTRWLTERLGFTTAQEAETQLADSDITLLEAQSAYEAAQLRIHDLEEDALVHGQAFHHVKSELDLANARLEELEQALKETTWQKFDTVSGAESQLAQLHLELHEKDTVIAKLQARSSTPLRPRNVASPSPGKENMPTRSSQSSFVPSTPQALALPITPKKDSKTTLFLQAQLIDLQERYDSLLRIYRDNVQQRAKEHKVWKEFKDNWVAKVEKKRRDVKRERDVEGERAVDSPRKKRKTSAVEPIPQPATIAKKHEDQPTVASKPTVAEESQTQYEDESVPATQELSAPSRPPTAQRSQVLVPASSDSDLRASPARLPESPLIHHTVSSHRPSANIFDVAASTSTLRTSNKAELATTRQQITITSSEPVFRRRHMGDEDGEQTPVNGKGKGRMLDDPEAERLSRPSLSPKRSRRPPGDDFPKSNSGTPSANLPIDKDERAKALRNLGRLPNDQYTEEYKGFKGHGRYQRNVPKLGEEGINAKYQIDTSKNHGVAYQYDEVVRDKTKRKHMHGADCECCRGYYEAVGPLPPRLQPPLWKSPSPRKKRKLNLNAESSSKRNEDDDEDEEAARLAQQHAHKQEISRHRAVWVPPNTPPDYWNIGFPTTQQAENINRRAEEMHRRKEQDIAKEAERKDGRYKRRN